MNSVLNGTTRKIACQAAKNSTTASSPSSRLRCRAAKLSAGRRRRVVRWHCGGSDAIGYTVISSLSAVPDFELQLVELRRHPHLVVARPRQIDREDLLGAARTLGHHHDAVGQVDRLVDLMGDEQHGLLRLLPDAQQLDLHQVAGLRVERRERLVHQQHVRDRWRARGQGRRAASCRRTARAENGSRSRQARPSRSAAATPGAALRRPCP